MEYFSLKLLQLCRNGLKTEDEFPLVENENVIHKYLSLGDEVLKQ